MKLATFVSAALAATTLVGCGDSMFTAQERGDSILDVRGQAISAAGETAPATDYVVGVLFMRHVWNWTDFSEYYLDVEFVKGTLTGNFPADFQVELVPPTETYPHNSIALYESWDDRIGLEVFAFNQDKAPKGVRIGHLVVGPKAELEALPRRIPIEIGGPALGLTFGESLQPYLPKTTVTSYQVIYSEGISESAQIYRFAEFDSYSEGITIKEGYTLLDATTFTRSVQWSECAKTKRAEALTTPLYQSCADYNAPYGTCLQSCITDYPAHQDRMACYAACDQTYPDMVPDSTCVLRAQRPLAEAACGGPEVTPDIKKLKVLNPIDALSVRLGEDDVKTGLWALHSTILNRVD